MKNKNRVRNLAWAWLGLNFSLVALADQPPMQRYNIIFSNPSTSCTLIVEEIDNECTQDNKPNFLGVTKQTLSPKGSGGEEGSTATIGFLPFLDSADPPNGCDPSYASFKFTYPGTNWQPQVCTVKHYFNDDGSTGRLVICAGDWINVDGGADQFSNISFSPDVQNLKPCSVVPPDEPPSG